MILLLWLISGPSEGIQLHTFFFIRKDKEGNNKHRRGGINNINKIGTDSIKHFWLWEMLIMDD